MPRNKERRKVLYEPSTHEIFSCLSALPKWSQILLEHRPDLSYTPFLKWLVESNYFNEREEKLTIKKLATDFRSETAKVTRWIHKIYEDIIELNCDKPELFTQNKTPVRFYIHWYDNFSSLTLGLDVIPRVFETFRFPFIHAKIGIDSFWVSRVEHEVFNDVTEITIWLDGGILNRYREFVLEEALFKGWIGFMDKWHKTPSEIDEIVRQHLRR